MSDTAPPSPHRLARLIIVGVVVGALAYVGIAAWVGAGKVGRALDGFRWSAAAVGLGLAALNYALRWLKWEVYLRTLELRLRLGESVLVFLSGFALTVTPGKLGEVVKSYWVRELNGAPMARTAPIVVAERVTDLIALLALAVSGSGALLGGGRRLLWVAGGLVLLFLVVVSSETLSLAAIGVVGRMPVVGARLEPKLREFYRAMAALVRPGPLVLATLLSAAAWAAECLAFWSILRAFPVGEAGLWLCTFIYASMTIAGALSFIPGGLLVQEGGMVTLLVTLAVGVGEAQAAAATFVTRLCTLWFAVLVGVVATLLLRRRLKVAAPSPGG